MVGLTRFTLEIFSGWDAFIQWALDHIRTFRPNNILAANGTEGVGINGEHPPTTADGAASPLHSPDNQVDGGGGGHATVVPMVAVKGQGGVYFTLAKTVPFRFQTGQSVCLKAFFFSANAASIPIVTEEDVPGTVSDGETPPGPGSKGERFVRRHRFCDHLEGRRRCGKHCGGCDDEASEDGLVRHQ